MDGPLAGLGWSALPAGRRPQTSLGGYSDTFRKQAFDGYGRTERHEIGGGGGTPHILTYASSPLPFEFVRVQLLRKVCLWNFDEARSYIYICVEVYTR